MSDHLFRLMERHQKVDRLLGSARTRRLVDPFEIVRLEQVKLAVKGRLAAAMRRPGLSR